MNETQALVIDASVALKWFATQGEDSIEEAASLLGAHGERQLALVGPALLVHELMHVLRRRKREVSDLPAAMDGFFDAGIALVTPDRELMISTARLCVERQLSTSDATYAALALILDCELVTADRRLARALDGVCPVRVL
ncbi:MAG: type II toxin-antitoxin system VapC family toxin [Coriobacteriia bacterium]|nr:type II toxin-antitoxin system VapC family toxin [Coriobacteriia bacterium]